ncbi:MAG: chorismate mutase [Bacteroidales bacterium]|nr:chorismate mutase [Bacteroidales bacterium]
MPGAAYPDIIPVDQWLTLYEGLLIIAGPCSVESRQQLELTARGLADTKKISVFRAGIWKPRSRPGRFEGVGAEAFSWLTDIREETGMPVAVEVARPNHVELCLKHGIDIIWLGARTSVNPFLVQEIANACRGTNIPVMIKNPISPDLRLWVGAIERMAQSGIKKLIAIHRGFQSHPKSMYRNRPHWDIPAALKKEIPGIPIVCDPSHIAGNRQLIPEVAAKALAMRMNGLMVETHFAPETAKTDPEQQITPERLNDILEELLRPEPLMGKLLDLDALRTLIDEKDHQLLEMLADRMSLSELIGELKKEQQTGIRQPDRKKDILADRQQKGTELGLSKVFIKKVFSLLHEESVIIQRKKMAP